LTNSSNRAIVLLKLEGRIFAISFGYGQYLINPAAIERNFGLKTSLNTIIPDKLRSMDKAKLDELTVQTRIQSSVMTDRGSFNIDVIGDLLRSITGETNDKSLGNIVTGTDAIYISPKIDFSDIKPIVHRIMQYHSQETYKENFDWIDNLEHEKNPTIIDDLNESLVAALKNGVTDLLSIAPPFILDWTSFAGVSYSPKGDLYADFDIIDYYNHKVDLSDFTFDKLKASYLYMEDGENETRSTISLMKCLNYQTEINNNLYVRTLGNWYRISKIFSDKIYDEAMQIAESPSNFIDCEFNWDEETYNANLANSSDDYSLFDRKLVKCEATRSTIEVCDILTKHGEFIHIKPKNSSSTLSHLFSQGRISSIAFNSDKSFRREIKKIIRNNKDFDDNFIPLDKVNNSNFMITFATITKGDKSMIETLPFFSLLNLRQSSQFLSEHGFDVRIKKIRKLEN